MINWKVTIEKGCIPKSISPAKCQNLLQSSSAPILKIRYNISTGLVSVKNLHLAGVHVAIQDINVLRFFFFCAIFKGYKQDARSSDVSMKTHVK